jgi:MFS family permease
VFGQAPLRVAVEAFDWRSTTLALAAGGVLIGISAFAFVRDRWRGTGGVGQVLSNLAVILRHRQTWLIALAGLGTSAPLLAFAGLWGVPFLEAAYHLPRTQAATLTSAIFAGWGIGAPLIGWLSDRIGRRRPPLIAGLILQTAALGILVYVPGLPVALVAVLCFLIGFFGSAQIVCFALVKENHAPGLSGAGIGFVNGMITGAGAFFQPVVGLFLDLAWGGESVAGARVYDVGAYQIALGSLVACCLGGLACLLAVRETYCRPHA